MQLTNFVRNPWGESGTEVDCTSIPEAMRKANLNWKVEKSPAYMIAPTGHTGVEAHVRVEDEYFIRRKDRPSLVFGRCKKKWTPLQNVDAFAFFQPWLDSGTARIHTVGKINHGQRIWVLAEMQDDAYTITGNDRIHKFILLVNSHDAKTSVMAGLTPIRFSCTNMLNMLSRDENSQMVKIRHTATVTEQVAQLQPAMEAYDRVFKSQIGLYQKLAYSRFDLADLHEYIKTVFNLKPPKGQTALSSRSAGKLTKIVDMVNYGFGNDQVNIQGTWWAAYNGVTQYLNYEHGKTTNARLNALWFGANQRVSREALTLAHQFTVGA